MHFGSSNKLLLAVNMFSNIFLSCLSIIIIAFFIHDKCGNITELKEKLASLKSNYTEEVEIKITNDDILYNMKGFDFLAI